MDILGGAKREILHMQAERNFNGGRYKEAAEQYARLFEMVLESQDDALLAKYDERLGDCYEKMDHHGHRERVTDHKKAAEHYVKAANRYRKLQEYEKAGVVYERGAKAFEEFDDFKEAAEFYRESAIMFIDVNDFVNASYAYNAAAAYYEKDGEYEKAAKIYKDAAICDMKVHDTASASLSFKKAAGSYEKAKAWEKAIDAYAGSIGIDTINRQYLDVADTYEKMGACYWELNDSSNTVYYNLKSGELRMNNDDLKDAGINHRKVGDVYNASGDYDKAVGYYLSSAKIFFKANSPSQEAVSFARAGKSYEAKGEYENSGNQHLEAGKANRLAGNEALAVDGYVSAAEMHLKAAAQGKDRRDAARLHMKAALAYSEVKYYERAADAYNNHAKLLWAAGDRDAAIAGWKKAAEEYVKGGRVWEAAEAYVCQEDYGRGAELYDAYANELVKKKDAYGIALGSMEAGNCYRRLGNESVMKARLDKAIAQFWKTIDENKAKGDSKDALILLGDAYRKTGECDQMLWEYQRALDHYAKAEGYYEKAGEADRLRLAKGLRLKAEAIKAIDHGYYPKADELLAQAKELLDAAIEAGGWKKEYAKILSENSAEAADLREKIRLKPEIILDIDRYSYTFANIPIILNITLTNNGKYTMRSITFLEHLPDEIKLLRLPDSVPEVEPAGALTTHVELTPLKTGLYMMRPIEVYYEDQKAHKYVKACNDMSLEVVERPPTDYKNYVKALEVFKKYSETQEANRNWFQGGDGYRQMAEVYGRFRSDDALRGYYAKSVANYMKYAEERDADSKTQDKTLLKRLADALWWAAEGMRNTDLLEEASETYERTVPLYQACRADNLAARSRAFKLKADGVRAIKTGDYGKAETKLTESLGMFDEVVKSGGYDEEGLAFLQRNEDEARKLLADVMSKPDVRVDVSCQPEAEVGESVTVKAVVKNPLGFDIRRVKAVPNVPAGLELEDTPPVITAIKSGGTAEVSFRFKVVKPGEYGFSPLEVTYIDDRDRNYMRSSGEAYFKTTGYRAAQKADVPADAAVKRKDDVSLEADRYTNTFAGTPVLINVTLSNNADYNVKGVTFLQHIPDHMNLGRLPEPINQLQPGESRKLSVEVTPTRNGLHIIRPVEVYYEDPAGRRYVKASTEMSLEVMEKPPADYKNYQAAVDSYRKYAQTQETNRNWFQAGDGYRQMAEAYGKFRSDDALRGYHMKAVENYGRYAAETEAQDESTLKRLADARWWIGLALTETQDLRGAVESFNAASEAYRRSGQESLAKKADAMSRKNEGTMVLKTGDLALAEARLNEALKLLVEVSKAGGFDEDGLRFLQRSEADVRATLDKMKTTPGIQVTVAGPGAASAGEAATYQVTVRNPLNEQVLDVKPMIKPPDGLEIVENTRNIGELPAGGSGLAEFKLRAKRPGTYRFIPVEVSYTDLRGKTYMRGCNEVTLNVAAQEAGGQEGWKGTPSVSLEFPGPYDVKAGEDAEIEGVLANEGEAPAAGIRFMGAGGDVEVIEAPEPVEHMPPKGRVAVKATVRVPRGGTYKAKLIEFFYKDQQGRRFFKSSGETTFRALGQALPEPNTHAPDVMSKLIAGTRGVPEGKITLVVSKSENHGDAALGMLDILARQRGIGGVYLSVTQPYEVVKASSGAKDVYYIDCISRMAGKGVPEKSDDVFFVENPSSLEEMSLYLDRLLVKVKSEKKFIFIDSLSSLLIYNTDKSVKEFTHYMINKIRLENLTGVILSIEKREAEDIIRTISPMCDTEIRL